MLSITNTINQRQIDNNRPNGLNVSTFDYL